MWSYDCSKFKLWRVIVALVGHFRYPFFLCCSYWIALKGLRVISLCKWVGSLLLPNDRDFALQFVLCPGLVIVTHVYSNVFWFSSRYDPKLQPHPKIMHIGLPQAEQSWFEVCASRPHRANHGEIHNGKLNLGFSTSVWPTDTFIHSLWWYFWCLGFRKRSGDMFDVWASKPGFRQSCRAPTGFQLHSPPQELCHDTTETTTSLEYSPGYPCER